MILWIGTHPPISPACVQGEALECTVWIPPTVLCPWHRQLEKNGRRVAPAHPQSASQSQGENSVLSCGEIGNLFRPSLELIPSLEILCKCKLEEWLKSWLLSQEGWVAQANYLWILRFSWLIMWSSGFGCHIRTSTQTAKEEWVQTQEPMSISNLALSLNARVWNKGWRYQCRSNYSVIIFQASCSTVGHTWNK